MMGLGKALKHAATLTSDEVASGRRQADQGRQRLAPSRAI